jgi:hypothetical protein
MCGNPESRDRPAGIGANETVEIDGLCVSKSALTEAELIIMGWAEGDDFRASREAVAVFRAISAGLEGCSEP